jgi:hypothetical protein
VVKHADRWGDDPLRAADRPRLPKPEGVPAGDGRGSQLVFIHDHLRSEMRRIRRVVAQVMSGYSSAAEARSVINHSVLRANFWTLGSFCTAYCRVLTAHHTIEDEYLFPELRRRQDSLGPVVRKLEQEHEVIADVLTALDDALVALINGDDRLDAVQDHLAVLDEVLGSHLDYEEEELVEPLNRLRIPV